MSVSLYDLSVASHLQTLGGVANVLAKGEEYAAAGNMDLERIGHSSCILAKRPSTGVM